MKNPFGAARERKMHTTAAQRPRYRRMPIEVTVRCGANGTFSPVAVLWPDGHAFPVNRVLRVKKMRCLVRVGNRSFRLRNGATDVVAAHNATCLVNAASSLNGIRHLCSVVEQKPVLVEECALHAQ